MRNTVITLVIFFLCLLYFYKPVLLDNKYPIPSDNLVFLFHPFRDFYSQEFPRGVPYKNFLVTDPVTQQIPWKSLSIDLLKTGELPLWNPYSMGGYPLLGNIQSSPIYPLNFLLFLPFVYGWSIFIFLQQLLTGVFFFFYVRFLGYSRSASVLGSLAFSFSGFIIAWLEWGTVVSTGLWLPLMLLCIEKINKGINNLKWCLILSFSIISSFLAGHLQTFVYVAIIMVFYSIVFLQKKYFFRQLIFSGLLSLLVILPILLAQVQFLLLSARNVDLNWQSEGWFIPWSHLVQFIAPDFFGNPSTGNYFSIWNYGEFIGYIGVLPIILAIYVVIKVRTKYVYFFLIAVIASIIFSFPSIISKLPYILNIPLLSSAQPTRLLFIIDFSLCVLSVIGFDYVLKSSKRLNVQLLWPLGIIIVLLVLGYILVDKNINYSENWVVTKRNIILPISLIVSSTIVLLFQSYFPKNKRWFVTPVILIIVIIDLLFFSIKYTPFVSKEFYYPNTKTISYLQENLKYHRFMTTDRKIMHPNTSIMFKLQSIDGYDPLYLLRYGELMAAVKRNEPDITSPFGFSRIITPNNYESEIIDLLGVKYILSLQDLEGEKLRKVYQEGETRIYENLNVFPRVYFVNEIIYASNKNIAIQKMFLNNIDLRTTAIVEGEYPLQGISLATGSAEILYYSPNKIKILTQNENVGFIVLTDSYYPTWKAYIDNKETKIFRTNFNFRGIIVPPGKHNLEFKNTLIQL